MKFAALMLLAAAASGYDHRHPPKKHSKAGLIQIMDTSKGETSYDDGECPMKQYFHALWGAAEQRYQATDHSRDFKRGHPLKNAMALGARLLFGGDGFYD